MSRGGPCRWVARLAVVSGLATLLAPPSIAQTCPAATAEADVRAVFESYKEALVRGDGVAARQLVDAGTLDYFEELKALARSGSEAEVFRDLGFVPVRLGPSTLRAETAAIAAAAVLGHWLRGSG